MDRGKNLLAKFENLYIPAWTPAGRLVVRERAVYLIDADLQNGGQIGPDISNPQTPSVSPDGQLHLEPQDPGDVLPQRPPQG